MESHIFTARISGNAQWILCHCPSQVQAVADRRGQEALAHLQRSAFIPGVNGVYPVALETFRTTRSDLNILLRPVKIGDEPPDEGFFYALSSESMYRRFMSVRMDMPHERFAGVRVCGLC